MKEKYEIVSNDIISKYDTEDKFSEYLNSFDEIKINNILDSTISFSNNMMYARYGRRTTMSFEKNFSLGPTISNCVFSFLFPKIPKKINFSGQLASHFISFFRLNIASQNKTIVLLGQTNPSGIFTDTCRSYRKTPEVVHNDSVHTNDIISTVFDESIDMYNIYSINDINYPCEIMFHSPLTWNNGTCNGVYIKTLEFIF